MKVAVSFATALRALRVNKMRSALTMLGIVIGVAAVITTLAVGTGAEARLQAAIRSLGANLLAVAPGSSRDQGARLGLGSRPSLTRDDAAAMAAEIPSLSVVAPFVYGKAQAVHGNRNWATSVEGVTPGYLRARDWSVTDGRALLPEDVNAARKVALLGRTVSEKLFGEENPLGRDFRIGRVPFTVVGLLAPKGRNPRGGDQDDNIVIPLTTAKIRVLGAEVAHAGSVQAILAKVREDRSLDRAREEITALLRQRHGLRGDEEDDFVIRDLSEVEQTRQEATRLFTILLAAVASVSLVVGGVSIMNIMLVSVTERTREIGVRLAVGARRRDIRAQFLVESTMLSILGVVPGIVLGIAAAAAVSALAGWPVLIQMRAVLLAVLFAAAVGVFFGYYPAHKAARLDPMAALRFE